MAPDWEWRPTPEQRKLFEEWKKFTIGYLVSSREGTNIRSIPGVLEEQTGEDIPLHKMGFRFINQFLYEMQDAIEVRTLDGKLFIFVQERAVPPNMANIRSLVLGQAKDKSCKTRTGVIKRPTKNQSSYCRPAQLLDPVKHMLNRPAPLIPQRPVVTPVGAMGRPAPRNYNASNNSRGRYMGNQNRAPTAFGGNRPTGGAAAAGRPVLRNYNNPSNTSRGYNGNQNRTPITPVGNRTAGTKLMSSAPQVSQFSSRITPAKTFDAPKPTTPSYGKTLPMTTARIRRFDSLNFSESSGGSDFGSDSSDSDMVIMTKPVSVPIHSVSATAAKPTTVSNHNSNTRASPSGPTKSVFSATTVVKPTTVSNLGSNSQTTLSSAPTKPAFSAAAAKPSTISNGICNNQASLPSSSSAKSGFAATPNKPSTISNGIFNNQASLPSSSSSAKSDFAATPSKPSAVSNESSKGQASSTSPQVNLFASSIPPTTALPTLDALLKSNSGDYAITCRGRGRGRRPIAPVQMPTTVSTCSSSSENVKVIGKTLDAEDSLFQVIPLPTRSGSTVRLTFELPKIKFPPYLRGGSVAANMSLKCYLSSIAP